MGEHCEERTFVIWKEDVESSMSRDTLILILDYVSDSIFEARQELSRNSKNKLLPPCEAPDASSAQPQHSTESSSPQLSNHNFHSYDLHPRLPFHAPQRLPVSRSRSEEDTHTAGMNPP